MVCSRGDHFGDLVTRHDLGAVIDDPAPTGVARAIEDVLERGRGDFSKALRSAGEGMTWCHAIEPLRRWILTPPHVYRSRATLPGISRRTRSLTYRVGHRVLDAAQRRAT